MDLGLQERTAVITGGSMGIGKSVAEGLAAESVNIVLLARSKEALEEAAAEIQSASGVDVLSCPPTSPTLPQSTPPPKPPPSASARSRSW
jgi:NADP-dependent 3-hydroxy acid dehydrogenase YdfG